MGVWIMVATVLFMLGSFMALKPNGVDVRLDKLRMTARQLELYPKVVPCPEWVRGKDNELGRGMLGQYSLVLDGMKFPESRYIVIEGLLRPAQHFDGHTDQSDMPVNMPTNFALDKAPLPLPDAIKPFIKAVYSKANSIVVFWDDASYVKPLTNPNYRAEDIKPDLLELKSSLLAWADKLSAG